MTKREQIRYERPIEDVSNYERLYRYCTTRHSKGQLYRERLKELQQLTVKALREHIKDMEVTIDV